MNGAAPWQNFALPIEDWPNLGPSKDGGDSDATPADESCPGVFQAAHAAVVDAEPCMEVDNETAPDKVT